MKIDNFWDNVKKGAGTAKAVAEIKMKIAHEKTLLDRLYKNLGRTVYDAYRENKTPDVESICANIEAKTELTEILRRDLNRLLGVAECSKCHGTASNKYQYCPFCGAEYTDKTYGTDDSLTVEDMCDICNTEGVEDVDAEIDIDICDDSGESDSDI